MHEGLHGIVKPLHPLQVGMFVTDGPSNDIHSIHANIVHFKEDLSRFSCYKNLAAVKAKVPIFSIPHWEVTGRVWSCPD